MSSFFSVATEKLVDRSDAYLTWFSIITWVGVPINLYFAFPAFFAPGYLVRTLDLSPGFETVWLRNAGLLIFIITAYHILAAVKPSTYPAVGWMVIGGRLAAAAYWLVAVMNWWNTSSHPAAFVPFLVGDVGFGGVTAVLLFFGLRRLEARRIA